MYCAHLKMHSNKKGKKVLLGLISSINISSIFTMRANVYADGVIVLGTVYKALLHPVNFCRILENL